MAMAVHITQQQPAGRYTNRIIPMYKETLRKRLPPGRKEKRGKWIPIWLLGFASESDMCRSIF
uniref:Uncharacterized protein n=1 Tax=Manihot esculenta TaxID=3983 RepID=A0A2C9VID3_MANES